jgi:hypothetical protein
MRWLPGILFSLLLGKPASYQDTNTGDGGRYCLLLNIHRRSQNEPEKGGEGCNAI